MSARLFLAHPHGSTIDEVTEKQKLAAELRARGLTHKAIAERLGVSAKTIGRWGKARAFAQAVGRAREDVNDGSALATLRAALAASTRDGSPDWPIRLQAARLLLAHEKAGEAAGPEAAAINVHITRDGELELASVESERDEAGAGAPTARST